MKKKKLTDNQISVYQTPNGSINIEVLYANENIWLSKKRIAELFGCTSDNISLHLKNIYQEGELDTVATAEEFSVVQKKGNREVTRTVCSSKLILWRNTAPELGGSSRDSRIMGCRNRSSRKSATVLW